MTPFGHSRLLCGLTVTIVMTTIYGDNQPTSRSPTTEDPTIYVETSLADVVDKIMILQIKLERIKDPEKLRNIHVELDWLLRTYQEYVEVSNDLDELSMRLLEVDQNLWDLEDAVRLKEHEKCFDHEFVTIVNSILINNDERARIKRTINLLGSSRIIEEKSYAYIRVSEQPKRTQIVQQPVSLIVPLPLGDLVDRITILLIKKDRITDTTKHAHILAEYQILNETLSKAVAPSEQFDSLLNNLLEANNTMWAIQDRLRIKKQAGEFDEEFIKLGRLVYYTNDTRCTIKRQINKLFGSQLIEEKDYTKY